MVVLGVSLESFGNELQFPCGISRPLHQLLTVVPDLGRQHNTTHSTQLMIKCVYTKHTQTHTHTGIIHRRNTHARTHTGDLIVFGFLFNDDCHILHLLSKVFLEMLQYLSTMVPTHTHTYTHTSGQCVCV